MNSQYDNVIRLGRGMLIFFIILLFSLQLVEMFYNQKQNEKLCEKINMKVFTESSGGFFTNEELTCWNLETKEVKKIK